MDSCLCKLVFRFGALALLLLSIHSQLMAATLPSGFVETQVASGLAGPTAMAFAPDGRIFVCQQGGSLRVIKNGSLLATPFLTVTVDSNGERGLLGVAFDPNFAANRFIYIYYTVPAPVGGSAHNRVSRFTADAANPDVAQAGSESPILDLDNLSNATNHNGGAIHFGPDGKLYVAVGENANAANARSLTNRLGKILRINSDGTIPSDNPTSFPNVAGTTSGVNRAIWSLGLRNPFTFAFQPGTGRLFINDVGETTWEEINDGIAGSNYGWNICEGFCSPANANLRDPLFEYGHGSSGTTGCAITGGTFYNPFQSQYPGDYVGKYFYADLCSGWIRRFDPATGTSTGFATGISTPVDLQVSADGSLHYLARGGGSTTGVVFKITNPTAADANISGRVTDNGGAPLGGVTVRLGGSKTDRTITNADGFYSFSNLQTGGFYSVTPQLANHSFTPAMRSLSLNSNVTDAAFDATENAPTENALDTAEFFVRQQYLDFLGREPDREGFQYWSSQFDLCGGDPDCLRRTRINVSAAFFFEQEFQETGSFIHRMYKASFGAQATYAQFAQDRGRVIGGANLESSRQQFADEWVARDAFLQSYPQTMSATDFVGKLYDTAGLFPYTAERQQQIAAMQQGKTRAQVLRD
ncbi:MAG: PQQ-dependent sugar dehydrogenase, partial [Pyrinomonadaceae bacterium]